MEKSRSQQRKMQRTQLDEDHKDLGEEIAEFEDQLNNSKPNQSNLKSPKGLKSPKARYNKGRKQSPDPASDGSNISMDSEVFVGLNKQNTNQRP